jgi:hypothetical protein
MVLWCLGLKCASATLPELASASWVGPGHCKAREKTASISHFHLAHVAVGPRDERMNMSLIN